MKRVVFMTVMCALIAAPASAGLVDPDAFAAGTDISHAFAGVTLSSVGAGFDGDYDARIFAINPLAYGEPFSASTGSLVFGTDDSTWPHLFGGFGDARLRIDFSFGVTSVSLDAIGNDSSDYARLDAYDVANTLIDSYTTGGLATSVFEAMTVSGGSIAYVIASGMYGDSLGFDNLQVNAVPVPGAIVLGGIGMSIVSYLRRRRAL